MHVGATPAFEPEGDLESAPLSKRPAFSPN